MATQSVCSCFGNLRPRYKRLVDKIFPSNPQQGLVNSNMEKLTFYTLSAPEKLDRIGDYIFSKLNNYLYRRKIGFVLISIQAMDHLLLACRSSSLNMFVESFLRMVNTLLESSQPNLQMAATMSFIKFANIEEDTPSYHRRYDFFVSKFSEMCWSSHNDEDIRNKLKASGLKGLQGVIRKTVKDDLQVNIWDQVHMSKIIPSLLYNVDVSAGRKRKLTGSVEALSNSAENPNSDNPEYLAESCLREVFSRASFGNISAALKPIFVFLDSRDLWIPNDFAPHCFALIMYSVPNQFSYKVIEGLLNHLDFHTESNPTMRANIIEVIATAVSATSGGSIGPSVLEVFNTLLKHLQLAINNDVSTDGVGKTGPDSIIKDAIMQTAGDFSATFPGYQRVEVMTFIAAKIPNLNVADARRQSLIIGTEAECRLNPVEPTVAVLQAYMFRMLLAVVEKHSSMPFNSALPASFLDILLRGLLHKEKEVRMTVLEIMEIMFDRHKNIDQVRSLSQKLDEAKGIEFNVERCSKPDTTFIRKNSQQIYFYLYNAAKAETNDNSHIKKISLVICLIALEFEVEDVIVEIVGFVFGLQDLATNEQVKISTAQRNAIHSAVAMVLRVVSDLTAIAMFREHFHQVINFRKENCSYLLPGKAFSIDDESTDAAPSIKLLEFALFDRHVIVNSLKASGYETASIDIPYQPSPGLMRSSSNASIPEVFPRLRANSDAKVSLPVVKPEAKKITYEDLKNVLQSDGSKNKPSEILNFNKATSEEIKSHTEKVGSEMQIRVNRILDIACRSSAQRQQGEQYKDIFSIKYPDLYVI